MSEEDGQATHREEDELVLACPHCDRASVQHASRDRYRCEVCNETFAEPAERERRAPSRIRGDSLASALEDADPGDLVTDGGEEVGRGGNQDLYVGGIGGSVDGADDYHIFVGNLSLCGEVYRKLGQREGASFATHWDYSVESQEDAEDTSATNLCDLCPECEAAGGWERAEAETGGAMPDAE